MANGYKFNNNVTEYTLPRQTKRFDKNAKCFRDIVSFIEYVAGTLDVEIAHHKVVKQIRTVGGKGIDVDHLLVLMLPRRHRNRFGFVIDFELVNPKNEVSRSKWIRYSPQEGSDWVSPNIHLTFFSKLVLDSGPWFIDKFLSELIPDIEHPLEDIGDAPHEKAVVTPTMCFNVFKHKIEFYDNFIGALRDLKQYKQMYERALKDTWLHISCLNASQDVPKWLDKVHAKFKLTDFEVEHWAALQREHDPEDPRVLADIQELGDLTYQMSWNEVFDSVREAGIFHMTVDVDSDLLQHRAIQTESDGNVLTAIVVKRDPITDPSSKLKQVYGPFGKMRARFISEKSSVEMIVEMPFDSVCSDEPEWLDSKFSICPKKQKGNADFKIFMLGLMSVFRSSYLHHLNFDVDEMLDDLILAKSVASQLRDNPKYIAGVQIQREVKRLGKWYHDGDIHILIEPDFRFYTNGELVKHKTKDYYRYIIA